jgi:hypothetical protein
MVGAPFERDAASCRVSDDAFDRIARVAGGAEMRMLAAGMATRTCHVSLSLSGHAGG